MAAVVSQVYTEASCYQTNHLSLHTTTDSLTVTHTLKYVLALTGSDNGYYYTHLGAGESPEALREILEKRFSVTGNQLRMHEVSLSLPPSLLS